MKQICTNTNREDIKREKKILVHWYEARCFYTKVHYMKCSFVPVEIIPATIGKPAWNPSSEAIRPALPIQKGIILIEVIKRYMNVIDKDPNTKKKKKETWNPGASKHKFQKDTLNFSRFISHPTHLNSLQRVNYVQKEGTKVKLSINNSPGQSKIKVKSHLY